MRQHDNLVDVQSAGSSAFKLILKREVREYILTIVPQKWPTNHSVPSLSHTRIFFVDGCGFFRIKDGLPQPVVNPPFDLDVNKAGGSATLLGLVLRTLYRFLFPPLTIIYAEPKSIKSSAEVSLPNVLNRVEIRRGRSRSSMDEVKPVIIAIIKSVLS